MLYTLDNYWMILPHLLHSVSITTFVTSVFEFICSQTPYSMRGVLFDTMYGSVVLYRQCVRVWNIAAICKAVNSLGHWNHQLQVFVLTSDTTSANTGWHIAVHSLKVV